MGEMFLTFEGAKVYPQEPINNQFTLCKCYVMALGPNANKSNFKQEAVDAALPSLYNVPVIGHLIENDDGTFRMGSHDITLEQSKDGTFKWKWLTVPFGVVPEDCNAHYEEVTEADGTEKTYLVADLILWTGRYPDVLGAKYSDETYFNHSMEIEVFDSNRADAPGYSTVDKFQFSALCLLGRSDDAALNEQPCFPSSCVKPYAFADDEKWKQLFSEFKLELAKVQKGEIMEELENTNGVVTDADVAGGAVDVYSDGGAEDVADSTTEATTAEAETVETDSSNSDSDSSNYAEMVDENTSSDEGDLDANTFNDAEYVQNETELNANPEESKVYANLTYKEKRDKLSAALSAFCVEGNDQWVYYWLMDFDEAYVYAELETHIDGVYGNKIQKIPYAISSEETAVDMSKAEDCFARYLTQAEIDRLEAQNSQFEELKEYKAKREEDDVKNKYELILAKFGDVADTDEYKEVAETMMTYANAEDLETKLYSIRGKYAKPSAKKSASEVRFPINFKKEDKRTPIHKLMEG